jgi:hypothetical protein
MYKLEYHNEDERATLLAVSEDVEKLKEHAKTHCADDIKEDEAVEWRKSKYKEDEWYFSGEWVGYTISPVEYLK